MVLFTIAEVALELSIKEALVKKLIKAGSIHVLKMGAQVRVPEHALREYVEMSTNAMPKRRPKKRGAPVAALAARAKNVEARKAAALKV